MSTLRIVCGICGRLVERDDWGRWRHDGGTPLVKECRTCGKTWDAEHWETECPRCGSTRTRVDHRVEPVEVEEVI